MSNIGKQVVDELYLHLSALNHHERLDHRAEIQRRQAQISAGEPQPPNVAKINLKTGRLSLLHYPDFDNEAFPTLRASWSFQDEDVVNPVFRTYERSFNPPILHRKELLVTQDHPARDSWLELTRTAKALGLFDGTTTIGFKLNWERLIASKGYRFDGSQFQPLGNETDAIQSTGEIEDDRIRRHLTALTRNTLSAPVQLLIRSGLLVADKSFFDYGCGRGQDVEALATDGFSARGWDPHYAPGNPIEPADVVNLGFVVNVIEDAAERIEAVRRAFELTKSVMSVGVMLYGNDITGRPYLDGYRTSRNTFQKYFTQQEFKDYLEQILHREVFTVAPGVAFIFADSEAEQRYVSGCYRSRNVARRAQIERRRSPAVRPPAFVGPRLTKAERILADARPALDALWARVLELGRYPEEDEIDDLLGSIASIGRVSKAFRMLATNYDQSILDVAAQIRSDDLSLYFAMQQFSRRAAYRTLEKRLQRDIRRFFGDYRTAMEAGLALLKDANDPAILYDCCQKAASNGLGWLDGQYSLQFHVSLIDRLAAPLRAYIACGLHLYGDLGEAKLMKIHISSGKLTLLEFDDFDETPLPLLKKRVKINIRKLDYELFEYGTAEYPKPLLYRKSRYLHEDHVSYAEQLGFDEALDATGILANSDFGPPAALLYAQLDCRRLMIDGFTLKPSTRMPDLDERCGGNFTYRDFVECGDTQAGLAIPNIPKSPATYNVLYDLATQILDPLIEYFGAIRLTYGFSSPALSSKIGTRIAPKLDQHVCCELTLRGRPICDRGGAACDFIVDDEDMLAVANWIIANLPFDRLYFYGSKRPIHISFGPDRNGVAYMMKESRSGRLTPSPFPKSSLTRKGSDAIRP